MRVETGMFAHWRDSLFQVLRWFEDISERTRFFYVKAFAFFVCLNFLCYWWAVLTAYPNLMLGTEAREVVLMSPSVGVLGGLFDFLSLFVTLYMARRAIATESNLGYLGYLSVDFVIAILATLWVLFVFTVSGWLVNLMLSLPETLSDREHLYTGRFQAAITNPLNPESLRNIYFGIVMGASAMLPTLIHLFHAGRALVRVARPA